MNYTGLKVGIFTITDAINYGAFYQMYALYKYFDDLGADVTLYYGNKSFKKILIKYLTLNPKRQIRKAQLLRNFHVDSQGISIKKYKNEALDLAILGSDEIWNLENNSFEHFSYYYGRGINAKKCIAYAPSIGFANPNTLVNDKAFVTGVKNIDAIFPRDNGTKFVAEKITGIKTQMVPDPTILYNAWDTVKLSSSKKDFEYILYYGYTSNPPFLNSLLEFAEENNLPIISAGYNVHDWCDKNYTVGPFQFLELLRDAKYFFTTTFHGTVMATIYQKKFGYYATGQKIKDYASKVNVENKLLDANSTVDDINSILICKDTNYKKLINKYSNDARIILHNAIDVSNR